MISLSTRTPRSFPAKLLRRSATSAWRYPSLGTRVWASLSWAAWAPVGHFSSSITPENHVAATSEPCEGDPDQWWGQEQSWSQHWPLGCTSSSWPPAGIHYVASLHSLPSSPFSVQLTVCSSSPNFIVLLGICDCLFLRSGSEIQIVVLLLCPSILFFLTLPASLSDTLNSCRFHPGQSRKTLLILGKGNKINVSSPSLTQSSNRRKHLDHMKANMFYWRYVLIYIVYICHSWWWRWMI